MRIAIIANPYIPIPPVNYGGIEQIVTYLIKGLLEEGHEPVLFGPGDSKVDCELIPIVETSLNFPSTRAELAEHLKQIERINTYTEKVLRKNLKRLDIIHSQGFDMLNFQDFPNLTTIHGPIIFSELKYYLERKNLYFVSISNNQQKICPELQYAGMVYNGLDPSEFPIVEQPQDYLCFLGRLDQEKSPHFAIQLAISLDMPIKLAGKIDYQGADYFKHEIKPYLDHPLVEYLGPLGFKDKVELLSNAKCNLHPIDFREPFGLTVLEAAYCGTPTLATTRGSMPELIEDTRTGIMVEDFVEGHYHIQKCFEMDRNYIANKARMLFNYKTMARDYAKSYQRVIDAFAEKNKVETDNK